MGNGIASRFSVALSRVIDTPAPSADLQCDEDIAEIVQLVNELNQHQDLTVKLNNQSKICNIFKKNKQINLMNKKFESKNLDPQLQEILDKCRLELEALQEQKEEAIDEFLEQHTEERLMAIKKLEKLQKQYLEEIGDEAVKATKIEQNEESLEQTKKEYNDKKNQGLNEIKNKYNLLCQKVNVDTNKFVELIKQNRIQQKQAQECSSPLKQEN
jgi:phage-related protein